MHLKKLTIITAFFLTATNAQTQSYEQIANATVNTIVNDFRVNGDVSVLRGLIDIAFAALESEAAMVASCLLSSSSASTNVPATQAPPAGSILNPSIPTPSVLNLPPLPLNSPAPPAQSAPPAQPAPPAPTAPPALSTQPTAPAQPAPQASSTQNSPSSGTQSSLAATNTVVASIASGLGLPSPLIPTTGLGSNTLLPNASMMLSSLVRPTISGAINSTGSGSNGGSGNSPIGALNPVGGGLLSLSAGTNGGVNVGAGVLGGPSSNLVGVSANLLGSSGLASLTTSVAGLGVAAGVGGSGGTGGAGGLVTNVANVGAGAVQTAGSVVSSLVNGVASALPSPVGGVVSGVGNVANGAVSAVGGALQTAGAAAGSLVNGVAGALPSPVGGVVSGVGNVGNGAVSAVGGAVGNIVNDLLGGGALPSTITGVPSPVSGVVISGTNGAVATCTNLICLQASLPSLLGLSAGALPTGGSGGLLNVGVGILGGGNQPASAVALTTPIASIMAAASQVSSAMGQCSDLLCLQASLPGIISLSAGAIPTTGANLGNLLGVGLNLFGGGRAPTLATVVAGTGSAVVAAVTTSAPAMQTSVAGASVPVPTGSWVPVTSWMYIAPVAGLPLR